MSKSTSIDLEVQHYVEENCVDGGVFERNQERHTEGPCFAWPHREVDGTVLFKMLRRVLGQIVLSGSHVFVLWNVSEIQSVVRNLSIKCESLAKRTMGNPGKSPRIPNSVKARPPLFMMRSVQYQATAPLRLSRVSYTSSIGSIFSLGRERRNVRIAITQLTTATIAAKRPITAVSVIVRSKRSELKSGQLMAASVRLDLIVALGSVGRTCAN